MPLRLLGVSALLFGSGACALAYQLVWTRELRLVFGHSTAASAAVLAIFIFGLGAGSLLLGPRADGHPRPLRLYARLEALVALSAALTPLLLIVVRASYLALGGSPALGSFFGTILRLLLSALVLAVPTLLMGGTLPAAARAVEGEGDARRRGTALLYGANTLGAVAGALVTTFVALEWLGSRGTLFAACAINLGVAMVAGRLGRRGPGATEEPTRPEAAGTPGQAAGAIAPRTFVLASAAVVGFAFFLLELVWYRMLSPLLGGTVFTFGLILAVALLGIALGGLAYALVGRGRPATLLALSLTCLVEAAAVAAGFALGDRLAVLALLLRPLGQIGFAGHVLAWSVVTAIVVLPPALVTGAQFPLLVALLGRGREHLGRDIGWATACNTGGAMLGSLAGGFGLLSLLTAPGCWRFVAALLATLGLLAAFLDAGRARLRLLAPAAVALCVAALLASRGPTAAFRHSGIGAGRADPDSLASPNETEDWLRQQRRAVIWEADGRESSVALLGNTGLAFAVNGKIDGHSRYDAGTQVMSGLLGALLHDGPRRILVVGLGTGSTAGWLADVPGVERVDVVELEPAVAEVARRCALVNRNALQNPRLHLVIGDAREHLLASRERYDLIVSEPSNPYRAGVASLFSREFYRAVKARLAEDGLFLQWIQAYEIDARSLRSLYATFATELPVVESWQTLTSDLMLVGSRTPLRHDLQRLRRRVAEEPFRTALKDVWRTEGVEGVLARFVAGPAFAERLRASGTPLNTDDRNTLEFGFARTLGVEGLLDMAAVRDAASEAGANHPELTGGEIDLARIEDERLTVFSGIGEAPPATEPSHRRPGPPGRRPHPLDAPPAHGRPRSLAGAGPGARGPERARARRRGHGRRRRRARSRVHRRAPRLPARRGLCLPGPPAPAPGPARGRAAGPGGGVRGLPSRPLALAPRHARRPRRGPRAGRAEARDGAAGPGVAPRALRPPPPRRGAPRGGLRPGLDGRARPRLRAAPRALRAQRALHLGLAEFPDALLRAKGRSPRGECGGRGEPLRGQEPRAPSPSKGRLKGPCAR